MESLSEFLAALRAGGVTVYPLAFLAVLAAVVMLEKGFVLGTRTRLPAELVALVETYGFAWEDLAREVGALGRRS